MQGYLKWTAACAAVLVAATACGGGGSKKSSSTPSAGQSLKGVHLDLYATWSGGEQKNFQKVLDAFHAKTGATVTYTSTGDNMATVLGSKLAGGQPPDIALLPQPGLIADYAAKNQIKPLTPAVQQLVTQNYAKTWQDLATVNGKLYGVFWKAANKSTVWYRTAAFQQAGIQPPTSWADLVKDAGTLSDSGTPAFDIGGADGWTLTDWFENVYLSQAGPANYDKLAKHQIKWTDPTVKTALKTIAQIWANPKLIAGGSGSALQTDFPTSVKNVFGDSPKAAMVYEGDFVATNILETKSKIGTDANFFPFPAVGQTPPVTGGGDAAVMLKDNPGSQALMAFLASPEAATIDVKLGGFTSPNKGVTFDSYADPIQRKIAQGVIQAGDTFRFDMSDQAPATFGGTKGAGEWKDLQDFLAKPSDVDGTAAKLEADAAKAFKS